MEAGDDEEDDTNDNEESDETIVRLTKKDEKGCEIDRFGRYISVGAWGFCVKNLLNKWRTRCALWVMAIQVKKAYVESLFDNVEVKWSVLWIIVI